MLNEQVIEKVVERLVRRIEQGNEYVIKEIAQDIKKFKKISSKNAHKLAQILKYGGDYNKIVNKLNKISKVNQKEIYKIFDEVAKTDYQFAKDFYEYRNLKYIPYDQNVALKRQVNAIAKMTADKYVNLTNTKAVGLGVVNENNEVVFKTLKEAYYDIIDQAVLNLSQGKETFDDAMRKSVKELGNGLKTVYEYVDEETGEVKHRVRRLDSVVRMHLNDSLNDLHNTTQEEIGEQFDSDGVEITVHEFPAVDHELAQGRQFSNKEFNKLQTKGKAKDYKGVEIDLHRYLKDGTQADSFRPISKFNCYHYEWHIVLGVSRPQYTDKALQEIIKRNRDGFMMNGKHYTMYEGTQMQRKIESAIRNQKDIQISGRESGNDEVVQDAQSKITLLNRKYKELSEASGLSQKKERMRVSGYRRVKRQVIPTSKPVADSKYNAIDNKNMSLKEWQDHFGKKYGSFNVFEGKVEYKPGEKAYVEIDDSLSKIDERLLNSNLSQYEYLVDKYNVIDEHGLILKAKTSNRKAMAWEQRGANITYNARYYKDKETIDEVLKRCKDRKWINTIDEDKLEIHNITHEYGHIIEENYFDKYNKNHATIGTGWIPRQKVDGIFRDEILTRVQGKTGLTRTQIKDKYFSGYAKSKRNFEWFAEGFADYELGNVNPFTEELGRWIEENKL